MEASIEIKTLLEKYLHGTVVPTEEARLSELLEDHTNEDLHGMLYSLVNNTTGKHQENTNTPEGWQDTMIRTIKMHPHFQSSKKGAVRSRFYQFPPFSYAIAIVKRLFRI